MFLFESKYQTLLIVSILTLTLCPISAQAAVTINEVAWMGTAVSANDEWIELYNSGTESVSLDGWLLTSNGGLEIELAGSLSAGSYGLLERTDDNSAPGDAFLIYTGALSNTGMTLSLKRADGSLEDQIAGGEDWENIGGDNTTKETAQYTSGGWITAVPTPGRQNQEEGTSQEDSEDKKENESSETSSFDNRSGSSIDYVILSGPLDEDTELAIKSPKVVYVNQTFNLDAVPEGISDNWIRRIKYSWNLGDGQIAYKRFIKHTYQYPGQYVVVLKAKYNRTEQIARKIITVLPVKFSITRNSQGDVQINNDAKYEINLTGYRVDGLVDVTFPENTILLPGGTITIPKEELGVNLYSLVRLFDEEGILVASTNMINEEPEEVNKPISKVASNQVLSASSNQSENFSFQTEQSTTTKPTPKIAAVSTTTIPKKPTTATETKNSDTSNQFPYWLLIGVMAAGIIGLAIGKKPV